MSDLDALFDECKAEESTPITWGAANDSTWNSSWNDSSWNSNSSSWKSKQQDWNSKPRFEWNFKSKQSTETSSEQPPIKRDRGERPFRESELYYGVVVRLGVTAEGNDFCFLKCQETFALYSHDIRLQQRHCKSPLRVGDVLSFQLYPTEGQRPCASKATQVTDIEKYATVKAANGCALLDGAVYTGLIISNPLNWEQVLIECEALMRIPGYHKGIYVPKHLNVGLSPGLMVTFSLEMIEKGGLQACNIILVSGEHLGPAAYLGIGRGRGRGQPPAATPPPIMPDMLLQSAPPVMPDMQLQSAVTSVSADQLNALIEYGDSYKNAIDPRLQEALTTPLQMPDIPAIPQPPRGRGQGVGPSAPNGLDLSTVAGMGPSAPAGSHLSTGGGSHVSTGVGRGRGRGIVQGDTVPPVWPSAPQADIAWPSAPTGSHLSTGGGSHLSTGGGSPLSTAGVGRGRGRGISQGDTVWPSAPADSHLSTGGGSHLSTGGGGSHISTGAGGGAAGRGRGRGRGDSQFQPY